MRHLALLLALPLLLPAAGCGADASRAASSTTTGGGAHATTSTGTAAGGSGGSRGSGGAGGAVGTPTWCAPIAPAAAAGSGFVPAWVTPVGDAPADDVSGPDGVTVSAQGNPVLIGSFFGTFDLGTGTVLSSPQGQYDGYLAELSPTGQPVWLSEAVDMPYQVVADSGGVWVSSVLSDFTIARFGTSGTATWTWPVHPYDAPAIAPAGGGALWVADSFVPPSFDYGSGKLAAGGGAVDDVALLRFDASGELLSTQSVGALIWPSPPAEEHSVYVKDIAPAPAGGVLLLVEASAPSGDELTLLHLDAAGNVVWSRRFGASSGSEDPSLAADAAGDVLIAAGGDGEETFDLGCGPVSPGGVALVYVSADGTPRWSRSWDENVSFRAARLDPAGNALLAGQQYGPVDLGGGTLPWPSGATHRAVVLKIAANGAHVASRSLGDGPDQPTLDALTGGVTPTGELIFAGAYTGTLDLGAASGPLPTATTRTAFVAQLVP